jgi:hypothetical protein
MSWDAMLIRQSEVKIACKVTSLTCICTLYIYAVRELRARICKRLRSPGIDSMDSIPPGWESSPGLIQKKIYKFGLWTVGNTTNTAVKQWMGWGGGGGERH